MAGDNERFSARSRRWIKVAAYIGSLDKTSDESVKCVLVNVDDAFVAMRRDLKKRGVLEVALQAYSDRNVKQLHELFHITSGNHLVQIMIDALKMPESPKIALRRTLDVYIKRMFSDMSAQARTDPEVYRRTKTCLETANESIPAVTEKLAERFLNIPFGRWQRRSVSKCNLSDSLLRASV